jgi:SAM-dependent methyltransferase
MLKRTIKKLVDRAGYTLTPKRPDVDISLYESLYGKESVSKRRFYNIGAGGHLSFGGDLNHPCWTNVDLDKPWPGAREFNRDVDIAHDLFSLEPLPIESGSAELLFSRFAVEHITDEAAQVLFDEAFRILKKGGLFRITVPNTESDYRAYVARDLSYFSWRETFSIKAIQEHLRYKIPLNKASIHQVFLAHFATNASTIHCDGAPNPISDEELQLIVSSMPFADALNRCTSRCSVEKQRLYPQNHINWWSHHKFDRMLHKAGFRNVYVVGHHQSVSPVFRLRGFDDLWSEVAMHVEAARE